MNPLKVWLCRTESRFAVAQALVIAESAEEACKMAQPQIAYPDFADDKPVFTPGTTTELPLMPKPHVHEPSVIFCWTQSE